MKNNNGGPAFPFKTTAVSPNDKEIDIECAGMSLRDYFAAKIMAAFISNYEIESNIDYILEHKKQLAEMSFILSDEMVKEGEK